MRPTGRGCMASPQTAAAATRGQQVVGGMGQGVSGMGADASLEDLIVAARHLEDLEIFVGQRSRLHPRPRLGGRAGHPAPGPGEPCVPRCATAMRACPARFRRGVRPGERPPSPPGWGSGSRSVRPAPAPWAPQPAKAWRRLIQAGGQAALLGRGRGSWNRLCAVCRMRPAGTSRAAIRPSM